MLQSKNKLKACRGSVAQGCDYKRDRFWVPFPLFHFRAHSTCNTFTKNFFPRKVGNKIVLMGNDVLGSQVPSAYPAMCEKQHH